MLNSLICSLYWSSTADLLSLFLLHVRFKPAGQKEWGIPSLLLTHPSLTSARAWGSEFTADVRRTTPSQTITVFAATRLSVLIISCGSGRPYSRNYHTDHIYQIQLICIDIFVRYHRLVCSDQSGNRNSFDYSFHEWCAQAVADSSRWSSATTPTLVVNTNTNAVSK